MQQKPGIARYGMSNETFGISQFLYLDLLFRAKSLNNVNMSIDEGDSIIATSDLNTTYG